MSEQSVAFRYSKALLELAKEKNIVDTVYQDMCYFDQVCDENRSLVLALKSPVVKHLKKLSILSDIFKEHVNPVTFSIFEIITKKNREKLLPAIAEDFKRQYVDWKNIQKTTVTSAIALTDEQKNEIIKKVADATGKQVDLTEKIDASLIGGYVITIGDRQIDTSVKKKLNDLKLSFLQ
ncbi:MAG: ATP synthase F1 subunit delta [Pseudarcicella sp.]|jgi:F-type H+-transporting ATPase subunit delta|nr:ATP synthase F1 subunit delta [Pseudarcicella sp.]MBP6409973.1 ATP synthase F1 subunit delta [Pseudarcicella sp.]